jgi:hypothetical protein
MLCTASQRTARKQHVCTIRETAIWGAGNFHHKNKGNTAQRCEAILVQHCLKALPERGTHAI